MQLNGAGIKGNVAGALLLRPVLRMLEPGLNSKNLQDCNLNPDAPLLHWLQERSISPTLNSSFR